MKKSRLGNSHKKTNATIEKTNDGIDKMRAEMTEKDKESAVVYIK